jgi:flagellar biosynthesis/type III secretory pathway chaperone
MIQPLHGSENLPELLKLQIGLLDQLIELGLGQIQAIENERMSELLALLSDKQPLLSDLSEMAQRIRNLNDDPDSIPIDDELYAQRCRQLKGYAKQRFELLFDLEQKSESLLCTSRDQIAKRLEASSHSMTAISAYQNDFSERTQGARLDLSSDV